MYPLLPSAQPVIPSHIKHTHRGTFKDHLSQNRRYTSGNLITLKISITNSLFLKTLIFDTSGIHRFKGKEKKLV